MVAEVVPDVVAEVELVTDVVNEVEVDGDVVGVEVVLSEVVGVVEVCVVDMVESVGCPIGHSVKPSSHFPFVIGSPSAAATPSTTSRQTVIPSSDPLHNPVPSSQRDVHIAGTGVVFDVAVVVPGQSEPSPPHTPSSNGS